MLELSKQYFSYLNEEGIRYCHWKSNEHLDAALNGKTDVDILVHEDDRAAFEASLEKFDIKKILSPANKQFPSLEDYLGFDQATGSFIHLHVHYRLVMGQKYIKNHHLPLEELFFDNLIEKNGVKIPCPEIELILLFIRAHVKTDMLSLIKHAIKSVYDGGYTAFPQDIETEFKQLIERSDPVQLKLLVQETKIPLDFSALELFISRISKGGLKFHHILHNQIAILRAIRPFRRAKSVLIYISYFTFFVNSLALVNRFKRLKKKTLIEEGKVIAIVGADGSGKSTLSEEIGKWCAWKLTTNQYYYGIPKSTTNKLFSVISRVLSKLGFSKLKQLSNSIFWMYVAHYRANISRATKIAKVDGELAITDRFPLKCFHSMPEPMDGPRLANRKEGIDSYFSDRERVIYDSLQYPDLIIVLQVSLEELRTRKKDLPSLEEHRLKADAINSIDPTMKNVATIDANQPYEKVLLEVKRHIWQEL